jgi:Flp pilus assembly protein TadG
MHSRANLLILLACTLKRLRQDRSGASAIEFAIIGPLVLVVVFGIIELAVIFMATQYLETATQQSTRLIMTGQVKSANMTKEQFKTLVCDRLTMMMKDCGSLYVDAQTYDSFTAPDFSSPITNKEFVDNTKFITGKQGDIVVVRAFYKWPLFVSNFFYLDLSDLKDGKRLISASAAIRNEPW